MTFEDALSRTDAPGATLYCADALEVLRCLPDNSIDLIATDPPYFRVKGLAWDRAWNTSEGFIAWIGQLADEWQRVLKANGSLYCFASPRMAARVEVEIGKRFEINNNIVWNKLSDYEPGDQRATAYRARDTASFRKFFDYSERIIFAEHYGSDNAAKGESGYGAECDRLRGFVFEPLRAYLTSERDAAGFSTRQVAEAFQKKTGSRTITGMAGHWFTTVQWTLPTQQNYSWLRSLFGSRYLRREYEDLRREYEDLRREYEDLRREYEDLRREYEDLRREYEDLRREYEDLRRPFSVTADVPYTDVWDFKTVPHRPGKHPCEKPLDLCEHIILASSRSGAVVLDSFCGSGAFGHAAVKHGRTFIGSDSDPHWIAKSAERIAAVSIPPPQASLFAETKPVSKPAPIGGLFDSIAAE